MENIVELMWWIAPLASVLSLVFAGYFYKKMMASSEGTDTMKTIAKHVRDGAYAYLYAQYFNGWGESLLSYDQRLPWQLRLGIAVVR